MPCSTKSLLAAAALAALATPSSAQEGDRGWYLGASRGQGRADAGNATTAGVAGVVSPTRNDRDAYWKLYAGYGFSRHFALEAGYADYGRYSIELQRPAPAGTAHSQVQVDGLFADAVAGMPVGGRFSLFGRLGVVYTMVRTDASATGTLALAPGTSASRRDTEMNWKWGLGAGVHLWQNLHARLEYEQLSDAGDRQGNGGTGDIKLWSLGLLYRF